MQPNHAAIGIQIIKYPGRMIGNIGTCRGTDKMATLEEIMAGVRKAHEAGDTESARRLAEIANRVRSQPAPSYGQQPAPDPYGLVTPPAADVDAVPGGAPHPSRPETRGENVFGDVTSKAMEQPIAAMKAFGGGLADQSQSPTMQHLPEWIPQSDRSLLAYGGDAAMAGLSGIGALYSGGAGLVAEAIGDSKTDESRLARDLVMMGQVAVPELAGVSSATLSSGRMSRVRPPTAPQQAARAAEDLGVTPSLGMLGKNRAVMAAGMEKIPTSAGVIAKDATRAVGEIEGAFSRILNRTGTAMSPAVAGERLQEGLTKWVGVFKKRAEGMFDGVAARIPPGTNVELTSTQRAIAQTKEFFEANPELAQKLGLTNLDTIMAEAAKNGISWRAVRQLRTQIGESIGSMKGALTSESDGRLKMLYGALTEDMGAAAMRAGPDAAKAWEQANAFYRRGAQRIERSLDKTITASSPERAFEAFDAITRADRSTSDLVRLRQIKQSLPRNEWNDIATSIAARIGRAKPGAQDAAGEVFSPTTFLTNWNNLSKEARAVLFPVEVADELEKLALVANRAKTANLERNFSNTGSAAGWLATVFGAGADAGVTASALGASYVSAKGMTSPMFLRAMNRAARGEPGTLSAMAKGDGPFANDARVIMNLIAADTAANSTNRPLAAAQ